MKKIMIYCQHSAGMGHLVRSTEIIRSLVKTFEVCFVSGGQRVPEFKLPNEVQTVYLPALWQNGNQLQPLDSSLSLEEVTAHRQQILLETFDRFKPDCLITECFPFSKLKLESELSPLLKRAKNSARRVRIVCSLRDLIMTQPMSPGVRDRRQQKIRQMLERYYDAVLFHADEKFQKLADSFPQAQDLSCDIVYTGYVAQSPPQNPLEDTSAETSAETSLTAHDIAGLSNPLPTIVASVGGGRHGYPLLQAILAAAPLLATYRFPHHIYAFAGPFMPQKDFARLQRQANRSSNVTLRRYTNRLIDYLNKADLSVSLGGYNTTMNLLRTRVRSLVLPSPSKNQTDEQRIRANMLAQLGVIRLLEPKQLAAGALTAAIATGLESTPSLQSFNLQGADNTARYLENLLAQQPALKQPAFSKQPTASKQRASKQPASKHRASKQPATI